MTSDGPVRNAISGGLFLSPVVQGRDLRVRLPYTVPPALAGLPFPTPAFAGRDAELACLTALFTEQSGPRSPIVVEGPVGSGKTELVLKAAHQALARGGFPGGVLCADVSRVHGTALVGGFLRAMGVPAARVPAGWAERSALCATVLSSLADNGRPLLIVLDDVADPGQLIDVLPAFSSATTLVTTPVRLAVRAPHRLTVGALPTADATLLLRRALAVSSPDDTRITDGPDAAVRLAALCDGLPLALRTAAALLAESPRRPLAALVEDLADPRTRLAELTHPDHDLRARLDACHTRLDPSGAGLLWLLALREEPETATRTLAALAGEPENTVRERLTGLLHLIEAGGTTPDSWRLSPLVRQYVLSRRRPG
ncbi:ATP-binding protein [Streptomyces mangrovisoli]|uniref:Orc1-like AAA ATPase domain-containing protein n=1 Tax=Streptomyces mangrovisoli TaxID=1428628 RepID=A0A1J4NU33_9ACTN|nr:ATP-binding protein [Streptomyces mangrovisoli]OIJ64757.1 hypothetical protein WN71_027045 [Streptomyces mangrovisoli]